MKKINEMKLSFQSRSINESFARSAVASFAASLDPTLEELADLRTAVSEAVTNSIIHGYKDSIGTVYISAAIYPHNRIVVRIRDKGCGIEDIGRAMEPLYTSDPGSERAGLGFAVMKDFCDKVKVTSVPDRGTSVILTKRISAKSAGQA